MWAKFTDTEDYLATSCGFFVKYNKGRSSQADVVGLLGHSELALAFRSLGTHWRVLTTALEHSMLSVLSKKGFASKLRVAAPMFCKAICCKLLVMLAHSRYVLSRKEPLKQQLRELV